MLKSIESSFAHICFSFESLSLTLAKRLIATLKHYQRILEVWQQLIFSNLEVRFSDIWGGRKRRTWWGMWKWIGYPLTSVGDQSSPKLTPTLFAGLPYARNRSLDWDLFCEGASARLPSTSHAHKMNSRPGIIIYAASQGAFWSPLTKVANFTYLFIDNTKTTDYIYIYIYIYI